MKKVFLLAFAGFLAVTGISGSLCYAGTTKLVSVDSAGKQGNSDSLDSAISGDGRYVAFSSLADNLAPGATNGKRNIFVHDRTTGKTTLISRNSAGEPGNDHSNRPFISADGRYIAFVSMARNLTPVDTNGKSNIFIHDRQTGETKIISREITGKPGNNNSSDPVISADGRYVAFQSSADNLAPGNINGESNIFVHDRQTDEMKIISKSSDGKPANGPSSHPSLSADGRFVAFESTAGNLAGVTNDQSNIFVHDRRTGETIIVSKDSAGILGNNNSYWPAISSDGKYVAFRSLADNFVPGDTNGKTDIFVHDRQTGGTIIISKDSAGKSANGVSDVPAISADGRYVAFESAADNLVSGDINGKPDAFVHDRRKGETKIVSVDSKGIQGNGGGCFIPSVSANGRFVAFESEASNLVKGDTNGKTDIFVHDSR